MNAHPQKNILLQAAQSNAATKACKRVFFLQPQKNFFLPLLFLVKLFRHRMGAVLNKTVGASNVNRFVDRFVLNIGQTLFHSEKSGDTHNMGLNEMAGEVVNQTFVLLTNGSIRLTVRASKSATSLSPEPL